MYSPHELTRTGFEPAWSRTKVLPSLYNIEMRVAKLPPPRDIAINQFTMETGMSFCNPNHREALLGSLF